MSFSFWSSDACTQIVNSTACRAVRKEKRTLDRPIILTDSARIEVKIKQDKTHTLTKIYVEINMTVGKPRSTENTRWTQ